MTQLRQTQSDFEEASAKVVLVGMATTQEAEEFRERFELDYPIICDPERDLYSAFQLTRMSPWQLLSPVLALKGISAMSQGHLMGLPQGDVRQLPGVFVIDRNGMIRFSHRGEDPSDRPEPSEILEALIQLKDA